MKTFIMVDMTDFFYGFFDLVLITIGVDGIFLLLFSIIMIAFIVDLLLAIFRTGYSKLSRIWFFAVCLGIISLSIAFCLRSGNNAELPLVLCAVSIFLFIPIMTIRVKDVCVTEKEKNFIDFIDGKIRLQNKDAELESEKNDILDGLINKTESCIKEDLGYVEKDKTCQKTIADYGLDFAHVRNVMSRLDYFGLKESDKRLVKELEYALDHAERGHFDKETKIRINDGLGSLLKIMSKYGI